MKKTLFGFCVFAFSGFMAQEGLKPLVSNPSLYYSDLHSDKAQTYTYSAKASAIPLQLPFLEDFYYSSQSYYPASSKWSDSLVFVNSGYPIAPPSIGVATFDGLNQYGYPYEPNYPNLAEPRPADTLTSREINLFQSGTQILQPSDSIGLSFYYQARGNGEAPEAGDSLILDFFRPSDGVWVHRIWYAKGNSNPNLNDTAFKRAFIFIDTVAYLQSNFKFRFRNKATTSGNFDHWHLDYVYLNKNRSMLGDTVYNDLTFAHVPSSLLQNYYTMPYQQFTNADKAANLSVRIKNNGSQSINMSYRYNLYDKSDAFLSQYDGGANGNLLPFKPNGYSQLSAHAHPPFSYNIGTLPDSADFTVKHFVYRLQGASSDFLVENDTVYQKQRFRNYYAYDDGGAEGGYYVNGVNARMALRFTLNFDDTLRALRIYFDPAGGLSTVQQLSKFRIQIWANSAGGPGALIFRDSLMYPKYSDSAFKAVPEYRLTEFKVLPAGTYFIGIQQAVASGIVIGFDRNQDFHQNLYYSTSSVWSQSQIKGALMIHPVFGKFIPSPAATNEFSNASGLDVKVFPNPVSDEVFLNFTTQNQRTCSLYNSLGQLLMQESGTEQIFRFGTARLESGIYFLRIQESSQNPVLRKIIIQH